MRGLHDLELRALLDLLDLLLEQTRRVGHDELVHLLRSHLEFQDLPLLVALPPLVGLLRGHVRGGHKRGGVHLVHLHSELGQLLLVLLELEEFVLVFLVQQGGLLLQVLLLLLLLLLLL